MKLKDISEIVECDKLDISGSKYSENIQNFSKQYPHFEFFRIMYLSDGLKIEGYIVRNKNIKKKLPVVIFCRGGNNHPEKKCGELTIKPLILSEFVQLIDSGQIVLFATNYRGGGRSEGVDEFGGRDVRDVTNLYPIIQEYDYTDPNRVALYGWSRGCIMVFVALRKVDWVKCAIVGAPPVNLIKNKEFRPKMDKMLREDFGLNDKDLKNRSVIYWTSRLPKDVPILILHGSADWRVSVLDTLTFAKKLQVKKIPYQLVILPGGDHSLTEYRQRVHDEAVNWLTSYLINNKTVNLELHGR